MDDAPIDRTSLGPAALYRHDHPPVRNAVEELEVKMSFGQRVADRVATAVGSWPFIIIQSLMLFVWIVMNVYLAVMEKVHPGFLKSWDPYPFILLNLFLSMLASVQAPVIMMSQNRQDKKDRLRSELDFDVNRRAHSEIQGLAHKLNVLGDRLGDIEGMIRGN